MTDKKSLVQELISDLKQQRDHLRVKMHLGGQELKDEFQKLDDKLNQMSHQYDPVKDAVGETAADLWESLQLIGSEIKDGFKRIRDSIGEV